MAGDKSSKDSNSSKSGSVNSKSGTAHDKVEAKRSWLPSRRKLIFLAVALVGAAAAYIMNPVSKKELMQGVRDTLLSLQVLRSYGPAGWVAFVLLFVAQLMVCIPGTMVVDVALGNIYGAILGTLTSVTAKTLSAVLCIFVGRTFGKALGLEFPDMLRKHIGAVRTHPVKALFLARMAPISTGVKNYAFSLLPPEDVPIPQYALATIFANLVVTTGVCVLGAGADNLVQALDNATAGHR